MRLLFIWMLTVVPWQSFKAIDEPVDSRMAYATAKIKQAEYRASVLEQENSHLRIKQKELEAKLESVRQQLIKDILKDARSLGLVR